MIPSAVIKLHLEEQGIEISIEAVDRARIFLKAADLSQIPQDKLLTASISLTKGASDHVVWKGSIIFSKDEPNIGQLCVLTTAEDGSDLSLSWSHIPQVLDLFDGGYQAQSQDESGRLLDDITEFHYLVTSWIYHRNQDGSEARIPVTLVKPEPLVEIRELAFKIGTEPSKIALQDPVLVQIDLFEQTWFCVGVVSYFETGHLFVSMSDHLYQSSRRNGRRMAVTNTKIGAWELLDIGDFGMRAATLQSDFNFTLGQIVNMPMPSGFDVPLTIVAFEAIEERIEVRLWLKDDSPEIRRHWQQFVQGLYYPNLTWRNPENHEVIWKVYQDSGYLNSFLGDWLQESKEQIFEEWRYVDQAGPHVGCMVLGYTGKKAVATIGASRFGAGAWIAQAAAMSDKAEDIPATRDIYSWRTRMILMQNDGEYHVAIFERRKKFLERFFRKFYLQFGADSNSNLSWTEKLVTCVARQTIETSSDRNAGVDPVQHLLLDILSKDSGAFCSVSQIGGETKVISRPHTHLVQFTTSMWGKSPRPQRAEELPGNF